MSYYGKSLYLDFDNLPRVDHRFSLGRVLANGISAKICQGVDHDNGKCFFSPKFESSCCK